MVDSKRPKLVGNFIRQKREALGLSQRALGMLFTPPVTTQFISNLERGVTPLPPNHVPTLTQALSIPEHELLALLEREYTLKLSGKLGRPAEAPTDGAIGPGVIIDSEGRVAAAVPKLPVSTTDFDFMRSLYDAYKQADPKTRQAFATVCESILNLPKNHGAS